MGKPVPYTDELLRGVIYHYVASGHSKAAAAKAAGLPRTTFKDQLDAAIQRFGPVPEPVKVLPAVDENTLTPDEKLDVEVELKTLRAELSTIRKDSLTDDYIKRRVFKLADTPVQPPRWLLDPRTAPPGSPGVPTLFASDWHWGENVDATQISGVNAYNLEIAHARVKQLINSTVDLLKNHMVNPVYPGIVFPLGGDMMSGNIHEELIATNDEDIMPVVLDLFGVLVWCINVLADEFGYVFIPTATGNHGRDTKKIWAKNRNFTSFDWLLYCFLAKHFEADGRVQFLIPNGSDALYRVYNHTYLLTHGDQFRGGDGMIGALGPIIRGDHKKRSRQTQIGASYDTMILGHWHQYLHLRRLIVNSSLKGYDEYAYANNFGFEPPSQALWFTHPDRGITFSLPVYVDPRKGAEQQDWVTWKP